MRRFSGPILAMALVASMAGLVAAALSSTTTTQTKAKLVPNGALKGKFAVPLTASGAAISQTVSVVRNGTTFPTNTILTISIKRLLGGQYADGSAVSFTVAGVTLMDKENNTITAPLSNGSASIILDKSMGSKIPKPSAASGDHVEVIYVPTGKVVFTGVFGPVRTTTK